MTNFYGAEKKLNFADFLISRGEGDNYASAAYKHTLAATTILIKELADLSDVDMMSPQIIAKTFKKFNEPKAAEFSKFYIALLKLAGKPQIPKADVEDAIHKARSFMEWVKEHKV